MRARAAIVLALLVLVPLQAEAARGRTEDTVVLRFEDARSFTIETRLVATESHSSGLRGDFDRDGDGSVSAEESTEERCWRYVNGRAGRFEVQADTYVPTETRVRCDASGVVTPGDDGSRAVVYTVRYASPLPTVSTLDLFSNDRLTYVDAAPPAGRDIALRDSTPEFVLEAGRVRSSMLVGPWGVFLHFPPAGTPDPFWSTEQLSTELRLEEPSTILVEHVHRARGGYAAIERGLLDADKDGALTDAERAAPWWDPRAEIREPLRLDGDALVPVEASTIREGFASVDGEGEAVTRVRFRYHAPLSPDGFALAQSPWPGAWSAISMGGRELTLDGGLASGMVSDAGTSAAGIASGLEAVQLRASPEAGGPPPAPLPEATTPDEGARVRTTSIVFTRADEGLAMRWTIEDVRTGVTARNYRMSLDSDADNQVSADEAASHERGMRLVPPPAAWPFRLDDASPVSTSVHETRVVGLEGASNELGELRFVTVYDATFSRGSGRLRADPLDHGARVSLTPPEGARFTAASTTDLDDVRLDGEVLSGAGAERAWSVVIPAPPTAPTAPSPEDPTAETSVAPEAGSAPDASAPDSTATAPAPRLTPDPAPGPLSAPSGDAPAAASTPSEAPAAAVDPSAATPGLPFVLVLLAALAAILVRKER